MQYETGTLKVGEKTAMRRGRGIWGTDSPGAFATLGFAQ